MRLSARFLVVFLALRALLQPHGVCLCELLQGLEGSVARTFHIRLPLGPAEKEDPRQGCVLCKIPIGVRGEHAPAPQPPAPCLDPPPLAPETPTAAPEALSDSPQPLSPARALYLSQCSLVI